MNGQPNPARIAHLHLLRLAEAAPQDDLLDGGPKLKKDNSTKLFSSKTRTAIIKAYGRKGWLFFALYRNVYRTFLGYPPPPEGLAPLFKAAFLVVRRQLEREETVNQFSEYTSTILMGLKKIDRGTTTTTIWKTIAENYARLILAATEDKDLYLIERKMPGTGSVPWNALWLMPKKQQELERVRHEDPDLYDRLLESKDLRKKINAGVEKEVLRDNRVIGRSNIRGRVVITGTNPKVEGDVYVYDDDGERLTKDQYAEKLTKKREQYKALRKPPTLSDRELDSIRTIPAEVMAKLEGKPTKYKSLTDDPDLSTSLTRIYEVVEVWGVEVVASGKYKGMAMPDLVNRLGRQLDGRIYDYDPKTGQKLEIETKNPDGTKNIAISREPYATLDSKGLLLNIPGANHFAVIRNDLKKLAKLIPSIKWESVPGNNQINVRFDPANFAIIREKVGGMALSNAGMKFIKAHFDKLAKNELATAEENLGYYEAEKLGGFGEPWPGHGGGLTTKQKQALAWLDSNGNKGVCALDTGMGKTVTSIAIMQKLERDGLLDDPDQGNGRYLYVCPAALTGNVAKEMYKFLIDADGMLERTDVMSYAEFAKKRGHVDKSTKAWVPTKFGEDYVAIFFDEAQALKNPGSQRSMAASSLNHPRKILMTASPMERSPQEVYSLTAISNNIDLTTKEARKDRNRFMRRFSESVGGRIVGIKSDDPVTARDFRVWVKQNLYFADKRDPKAIALPDLIPDGGTAVTMPPEIEKAYKKVTKSIAKELKEASKKFKKDPRQMSLAMESLKVKLASEMFEMTRLANIPNWEFEDVPAPTAKKPKATKRKWTRNPDIPNAKMDMAGDIVSEKIAQDTGKLTLLFTDSPEMAMESAIQMSEKFPGRAHIIGFASKIEVWANNKRTLSFGPRAYVDLTTGEEIDKGEWKVHVLHHLATNIDPVRGDRLPYEVATATLTSTYAVGQNLQMFTTVVHLDRDTWNSETMKQRTARAWRAGQESAVEERTLDVAYSDTKKKNDQTLDDVRKVIQEMDAALFDEVVVDSQAEVLGVEWHGMKKNESALHEVNKRMLEMAMSPYASNLAKES